MLPLVLAAHAVALVVLGGGGEPVPPRVEPPRPLAVQLITVPQPPAPAAPVPVERPKPVPPKKQAPAPKHVAARPVAAPTPVPAAPTQAIEVERAPAAAAEASQEPAKPVPVPAPAPVTPVRYDAAYLRNPAPAYPPLSRRLGEQGRVQLRVYVNADGAAESVELKVSSGYPRLDDAAVETVRKWRFAPARQGDKPLAAWVIVPINFQLEG